MPFAKISSAVPQIAVHPTSSAASRIGSATTQTGSAARPRSTADAADARRVAIYAGSFDPVTRGHLDVIQRARPECDHLIVAIGRNANKPTHLFSEAERIAMLRAELQETDIEVDTFEGLLATYDEKRGATLVIRGLRGWRDWGNEAVMAGVNFVLGRGLRTRFIKADPKLANVSSTQARTAAQRGEALDALVTPRVAQQLRQRCEGGEANDTQSHAQADARVAAPTSYETYRSDSAVPPAFGHLGEVALHP